MKTLTVFGRRWFQRTYGNTYHSAVMWIDGEPVLNTGIHYGYGDQYLYTALEAAEKAGIVPPRARHANGGFMDSLRQWAEDNGYKLHYEAADVARERDL